ncbi:hypothetical protein RUM44_004870 [Polyplax serrata]|uniref:Uncharacterized protein n=1 Tax=Polyplax serrata TaxID=468196 RepID=A0ABR1B431_POLSC
MAGGRKCRLISPETQLISRVLSLVIWSDEFRRRIPPWESAEKKKNRKGMAAAAAAAVAAAAAAEEEEELEDGEISSLPL